MADRCECGLPLDPPAEGDYYWPSIEQPDDDLSTVVRYREHPTYLRVVRIPGGWWEWGSSVDGIGTPGPIPWDRVGRCWAGEEHAVVAVREG